MHASNATGISRRRRRTDDGVGEGERARLYRDGSDRCRRSGGDCIYRAAVRGGEMVFTVMQWLVGRAGGAVVTL